MSQSEVEELLREGIQHHDQGEYQKAIENYEKALKIAPEDALVNYELSLTYFHKGDYKKSIKYADIVLKQNGKYMIHAYVNKGSSLDLLGKTKESIKLFEKAIKKSEAHYLLFYNLAVNYLKIDELKKAEENLFKAIEQNPFHSSSHLMLATIHAQSGNSVQTILAAHYFLLLEPNSPRSASALEMLINNFGGRVSKNKDGDNQITITISENASKEFRAVETMLGMLEASKTLEENADKTIEQLFVENTELFFGILGEMEKKKSKGIWWELYIPFFYELASSNHLETYCMYIMQSVNEASQQWLSENEDKLAELVEWLKRKLKK